MYTCLSSILLFLLFVQQADGPTIYDVREPPTLVFGTDPDRNRALENNYNTLYNYYYNINLKPRLQNICAKKYWRIHNAKY